MNIRKMSYVSLMAHPGMRFEPNDDYVVLAVARKLACAMSDAIEGK